MISSCSLQAPNGACCWHWDCWNFCHSPTVGHLLVCLFLPFSVGISQPGSPFVIITGMHLKWRCVPLTFKLSLIPRAFPVVQRTVHTNISTLKTACYKLIAGWVFALFTLTAVGSTVLRPGWFDISSIVPPSRSPFPAAGIPARPRQLPPPRLWFPGLYFPWDLMVRQAVLPPVHLAFVGRQPSSWDNNTAPSLCPGILNSHGMACIKCLRTTVCMLSPNHCGPISLIHFVSGWSHHFCPHLNCFLYRPGQQMGQL